MQKPARGETDSRSRPGRKDVDIPKKLMLSASVKVIVRMIFLTLGLVAISGCSPTRRP
jgi:hypothetical protein